MSERTIHRIYNPAGLDYVKDNLTRTENMDQEKLAEFLKGMLKEAPTSCFFVMAIENDIQIGHLVAFIHPSKTHVVLFDLFSKDDALKDQMLLRFLFWCENLQAPEVRFESERVKLDEAKWGFVPKSTTFSLTISNKVESLILSTMKKEQENASVCEQPRSEN